VMDQIRTSGHVERVGLGVLVRDATTDDAAYVGMKDNRGILVQDFPNESSPAKKAGLKAGDVIISVGGHNVDYVAQLQEAIAFKKPGEVVDVEVARKGGARAVLHIPLQRVPEYQTAERESRAPAKRDERPAPATMPSLGVTVAPTDADAVRELKLPADVRGAIVTDVSDSSPLAGRLATPQLGGPDVILSSPALRARTTAEAFGAVLGVAVSLDPELYGASARTVLLTAAATGSHAVAVVAHDPGMSVLAARLSGDRIEHMPTCAVATFTWDDEDWDLVDAVDPVAWTFDTPR